MQLSKQGLIPAGVLLLCELLFIGALVFALSRAEHEVWRDRHSKAVLSESNGLLKNVTDAELALYIYGTTNSEVALTNFKALRQQIPDQIGRLKTLLRNGSNQEAAYERILKIGNRINELLAQGSEIITDVGAVKRLAENRVEVFSRLVTLTDELRAFAKEQEKAEQIDPRGEAQARLVVICCLVFGVILNLVIAIFLAAYFTRLTSESSASKTGS